MDGEIRKIINICDTAIKNEDFDTLMKYYTEDAILVVKPGMIVKGKESIRKAFEAIAAYFNNSISPTQGGMIILETEDTALVLSQTFLSADKKSDSAFSMERKATYVFRKIDGNWLCSIDNSYGTDLLSNEL